MIVPYLIRIVCVCLASFFVVQLAAGLAVWATTPLAARLAHRIKPSHAARLLLTLRLLPCGLAILIVAAVCLPSYLRLEPEVTAEHVRFEFLAATLLGLFVWSASLARGLLASIRSRRFILCCQREGRLTPVPAGFSRAWAIEGSTALLALAGIFRPQLIVSRGMLAALSPDQLRAALLHEHAHWVSHDNLKRLLMLLTPDIFPFFTVFRGLERTWDRFTEWAADDAATGGNPSDAVSLAEALVQAARMAAAPALCPLMTSLVPDRKELPARVDRLLIGSAPRYTSVPLLIGYGLVVLTGLLMQVMLQPASLEHAYRLLEHLIN